MENLFDKFEDDLKKSLNRLKGIVFCILFF